MKSWKKWLTAILATCCIGGMAIGVAACGDDNDNGSGVEASDGDDSTAMENDVAYTLVLTDQDGNAVAGAQLKLLQGDEEIVSGTTDADGKMTGTIEAGNYVVEIVGLPEGYLADAYTVNAVITADDAVVKLSAENTTPNGTKERPFTFIGDADGYMRVTVPAGGTHYYNIPRPMGRNLVVEGADFEVIYGEDTYTPENGQTKIAFLSDATDTYAMETIVLVNKSAAANEITLGMPVPAGSTAEKAIEAALDTAITATAKGNARVYYTWTATADGELTLSTSTQGVTLNVYNENTYKSEDGAESVSISVSEGDKVLIHVGVAEESDAETTSEITFTLTLA